MIDIILGDVPWIEIDATLIDFCHFRFDKIMKFVLFLFLQSKKHMAQWSEGEIGGEDSAQWAAKLVNAKSNRFG
jgi:hypothetical protein